LMLAAHRARPGTSNGRNAADLAAALSPSKRRAVGKYLPGSVWPVVSQMEFGRRQGIARRTMLAANVITLALSLTVALILAAVLLPLSSPDALGRFWWTFLLLPPLAACVHPRTLPALLDRLFRLIKREPLNQRMTGRSVVAAMLWSALSWLLLGLGRVHPPV